MDSEQSQYGTVAERVARGVALVTDKGYSLTEIDLDTFDIGAVKHCALAQLTGSWYRTACEWSGSPSGAPYEWVIFHGFMGDNKSTTSEAGWLRDEELVQAQWQRTIAGAQGCAVPSDLFPTDEDGNRAF